MIQGAVDPIQAETILEFILMCSWLEPRNLKGGMGTLFDPHVNAMGRWPYWMSRMEVSYCTFGFGAIILHDLRTLLLPRDSPHDNLYECVIYVHSGKATHA